VTELENSIDDIRHECQESIIQASQLDAERIRDLQWELQAARSEAAHRLQQLEQEQKRFEQMEAERDAARAAEKEAEAAREASNAAASTATRECEEVQKSLKDVKKLLKKEVKMLRQKVEDAKAETEAAVAAKAALEADCAQSGMIQLNVLEDVKMSIREVEVFKQRLKECDMTQLAQEVAAGGGGGAPAEGSMDLLARSDQRISVLMAEAQLLSSSRGADAQRSQEEEELVGSVRGTYAELLFENASLRKNQNSLVRNALAQSAEAEAERNGFSDGTLRSHVTSIKSNASKVIGSVRNLI
ncbi:hypothetical protein CYMTET_11181, partial [Cymbomonas tetramitiformis]